MDEPRTFTVKMTHSCGIELERSWPENELADYLELAMKIGYVIIRIRPDDEKPE